MKLISWNVNGIRAALTRGALDFVRDSGADIICFQETKARPEQVADIAWPKQYKQYWNSAEKLGYSGTAIFTKTEPLSVSHGIGQADHDREGRVLTAEYKDFYLVNVYVPNSKSALERLGYRTQEWEPAFLKYLKKLEKKKPVIATGDFNVAHTEIDIARPKTNTRTAGFTSEERACFSTLLGHGFCDTFRTLHPDQPGHYSWWSQRTGARQRDIGWRIDYFVISESLKKRLKEAFIMKEVYGSDHCPVGIVLK